MATANATACIVGGLGSVGRQLQKVLLERGAAKVRVLDILDEDRAASSLEHPSVEYVPLPLGGSSKKGLIQALDGVSTVYSVVTPDVQHGTIGQFDETNHKGVVQLLEACRESPSVERFIYASSLAVTNHLISTHNGTEEDPLPAWDSYKSHYDVTKRLGEEAVLEANSEELRTCALRVGGVISDTGSYALRNAFQQGAESGRVVTTYCEPIDMIIGSDVAKALAAAGERIDHNDDLAGKAIFTTKCASNEPLAANTIAKFVADAMGWSTTVLPRPVMKIVQGGMQLQYELQKLTTSSKEDLLGIPPHVFLQMTEYQQSFDNSKARSLLDWEPEKTWKQGLQDIVEDYQRKKHEL